MPKISLKPVTGFIPIPHEYSPRWTIEIVGSSTYDVTTNVRTIEWNLPVTDKIGKCKLILDNNAGTYTSAFTGGETIKIYYDWSDGTSLKWTGILEKPQDKFDDEFLLSIEGIHISGKCLDITVTEAFTSVPANTVLNYLIDNYLSGFTYDNVDMSATSDASTQVTVQWAHKPFWECVIDLCNLAECDCYVDENSDFHFFEQNSKTAMEDSVVFGANLLENEGLGYDTLDIKNRIWVYGEDENGLPIVYLSENTSSQSSYNTKELVIKDTSIKTMQEAEDRANAELAAQESTSLKGRVNSLVLMNVNPGDLLWVSIPPQNIHNQYRIIDIIHKIDDGFFTTGCELSKPTVGLPRFFKQRMEREMQNEYISNPNMLHFSFNEEFNASTGSGTDTELSEGKLVLSGSATSGTWVSDTKTASSNISNIEFRCVGQDLESSTFEISAQNGASGSWQTVLRNTLTNVTNTGTSLKVRIVLNKDSDNNTPQMDSYVVLFS